MTFPDRIERTLELNRPPATVWAALTTAKGLSTWFGDQAVIDLRPGGAGRVTWSDGGGMDLRVERVEEPTRFAFTWLHQLPEGTTGGTHVEFALEPTATGTRLHLVESGFAELPDDFGPAEYESHDQGWTTELGELADYVNG